MLSLAGILHNNVNSLLTYIMQDYFDHLNEQCLAFSRYLINILINICRLNKCTVVCFILLIYLKCFVLKSTDNFTREHFHCFKVSKMLSHPEKIRIPIIIVVTKFTEHLFCTRKGYTLRLGLLHLILIAPLRQF